MTRVQRLGTLRRAEVEVKLEHRLLPSGTWETRGPPVRSHAEKALLTVPEKGSTAEMATVRDTAPGRQIRSQEHGVGVVCLRAKCGTAGELPDANRGSTSWTATCRRGFLVGPTNRTSLYCTSSSAAPRSFRIDGRTTRRSQRHWPYEPPAPLERALFQEHLGESTGHAPHESASRLCGRLMACTIRGYLGHTRR